MLVGMFPGNVKWAIIWETVFFMLCKIFLVSRSGWRFAFSVSPNFPVPIKEFNGEDPPPKMAPTNIQYLLL